MHSLDTLKSLNQPNPAKTIKRQSVTTLASRRPPKLKNTVVDVPCTCWVGMCAKHSQEVKP